MLDPWLHLSSTFSIKCKHAVDKFPWSFKIERQQKLVHMLDGVYLYLFKTDIGQICKIVVLITAIFVEIRKFKKPCSAK